MAIRKIIIAKMGMNQAGIGQSLLIFAIKVFLFLVCAIKICIQP